MLSFNVDGSASSASLRLSQLYMDAPTRPISLGKFVSLGSRRLEYLKSLKSINPIIKPHLFTPEDDVLSHFILRIVYSSTSDLRREFVNMETNRFALHEKGRGNDVLSLLDHRQEGDFLSLSAFDPIALPSVTDRKVVCRGGRALFPKSQVDALLVRFFRVYLTDCMNELGAKLTKPGRQVPETEVRAINEILAGEVDAGNTGEAITPEDIPHLSEKHFPLCMQNSYGQLRNESHLKHFARLQFGLFLKDIGLSLGDALRFWQESFSRKIPADKFGKDYAYNIRHIYGQEGKRVEVPSFGCFKIITSASGEGCGCPFQSLNADKLKRVIEARLEACMPDRIHRNAAVSEVMAIVDTKHYQVACHSLFKHLHSGVKTAEVEVKNPVLYFRDSLEWSRAKLEEQKAALATVINSAAAGTGVAPLPAR